MAAAGFFYLFIFFSIVFLPTIIAFQRGHDSKVSILILNIFLAWTVIGWIIALIWSVGKSSSNGSQNNVVVHNHVIVQGNQALLESPSQMPFDPVPQYLTPSEVLAPRPLNAPQAFGRRRP